MNMPDISKGCICPRVPLEIHAKARARAIGKPTTDTMLEILQNAPRTVPLSPEDGDGAPPNANGMRKSAVTWL